MDRREQELGVGNKEREGSEMDDSRRARSGEEDKEEEFESA